MPRFAFTCPSVLWAIGAAPHPGETPASTPSDALSSSVVARDIESLLTALDEFLTALHIAGYVPSAIAADLGFAACITIDLETMAVSDSTPWTATGAARPASAALALAIQVEPRASFAGLAGVALDLPKLTAAVGSMGFGKTAKGWMVLTASTPPPTGKRVVEYATTAFQAPLSAAMTAICADVVAAAKATTSLKTCGLVGIYDPSLWTFARPDKDSTALRKIAQIVATAAKSDAYKTLLEGQLRDVSKPFFRVFTDLGLESAQPTYSGLWKKLAARRYAMLHGTLDQKAKDAIDTMTKRGYTRALMLLHALHIADVIACDDITPVTPEFTNPDLTGGYYRTDGVTDTSTKKRDTLQINQAGKYLVGRWQRHSDHSQSDVPSLREFRHFTFAGDLTRDDGHQGLLFDCTGTSDPIYEIHSGTEFDNKIQIRASVDGDGLLLRITLSSGAEEYRRKHSVPFLERGVVTRLGKGNPAFVGAQDAPLHPKEFAEVTAVADLIEAEVKKVVSHSGDRRVTAANLDVHVRKALSSYASETSDSSRRFDMLSEQGALARAALIQMMLVRKIVAPSGETRSLWRWFHNMVTEEPIITIWMQGFFKISVATTQHLYKWTLGALDPTAMVQLRKEIKELVDKLKSLLKATKGEAEEGLIGFEWTIGTMTIVKYRGEPEQPTGDSYWTQSYLAIVGGLGGGVTVGFELAGSDTGWAENATEWKQANFVGPLGGAGLKVGLGVGLGLPDDWDYTNYIWQTQMLIFYGNQQSDGLFGYSNAPNNVGLGFFAGIEVGGKAGYLWMPGADLSKYDPEDPVIAGLTDAPAAGELHFGVDSPSLTTSGRKRIRELCAAYRANLEGVTTGLKVLGYASPSGPPDHNLDLSKKRAVSVYRAMREMLGERFAVPEELTMVKGYGEKPARDAGIQDGTESPEWRRVDVIVDGTAVSHLWY